MVVVVVVAVAVAVVVAVAQIGQVTYIVSAKLCVPDLTGIFDTSMVELVDVNRGLYIKFVPMYRQIYLSTYLFFL